MFAKLCNWVMVGSLACVLSACGGGTDDAAETTPANPSAAAGAPDVHAAMLVPAQASNRAGAAFAVYAQGPNASSMQINRPGMASRGDAPAGAMYGGGAYVIGDAVRTQLAAVPDALRSRATDPEVADDEARDRMALDEAEYERSFSMEKNRELAERRAMHGMVEPAVQQAYVPHPDCLDPRLPECAANSRLARY